MNIFDLIKIAGGIAVGLLVITVALSLFRRFSPRIMLRAHKIFGFATLGAAICHVVLIMLVPD
jgi:hypothetical protein